MPAKRRVYLIVSRSRLVPAIGMVKSVGSSYLNVMTANILPLPDDTGPPLHLGLTALAIILSSRSPHRIFLLL